MSDALKDAAAEIRNRQRRLRPSLERIRQRLDRRGFGRHAEALQRVESVTQPRFTRIGHLIDAGGRGAPATAAPTAHPWRARRPRSPGSRTP